MWYHLSPTRDLDIQGISPGTVVGKAVAARKPMPHAYLGTLEYIETQYLSYVPRGTYHLFRVTTEGLVLQAVPAGPNQVKVSDTIPAQQVTFVRTISTLR